MVLSHIMREEGAALDHRRRVIHTAADAEELHAKILDGAARTVAWLRNFDTDSDPMDLLRKLRFEMVGHDPLTGEALNMIEQLNRHSRSWRLFGRSSASSNSIRKQAGSQ
jgi:hypothetical protein